MWVNPWYVTRVTAHPHPRTGAWLSLASATLAALFLIPYKLAGERASADLVTLAMLVSAAVFNTLTTAGSKLGPGGARAQDRPARSRRLALMVAAVISVFTVAGNYAVAAALTSVTPGLVSVAQQTQIVFVAAISAMLLGERITLRFGVGVAVALAGFAVMYLPGSDAADAGSHLGALWALFSAMCFAIVHVLTRMVIHRIDPMFVNAVRLWLAAALMVLYPGMIEGALALDLATWGLATGAAFLGPFLGRLCLMYAVRHISASRSALLILAGPLFAFGFGFAALDDVPALLELLGSALILAGIALPLLERAAQAGEPPAPAGTAPPAGGDLPLTGPR
jgi:drug/metabolite transporter (DMT)-like permease